jgi:holo-[acyl-carrier protein] synthase
VIFGIGTDIVRVDRMAQALDQFGKKFAERILTARELDEFLVARKPAAFLAKRFAAKEATAKAMGRGFRDGLTLRQIGIAHDALGKPGIEYLGVALELKDVLGIGESFVSVADEDLYAVAYVTLLSRLA